MATLANTRETRIASFLASQSVSTSGEVVLSASSGNFTRQETGTVTPSSITITASPTISVYTTPQFTWSRASNISPTSWITLSNTNSSLTITASEFTSWVGVGSALIIRCAVTQPYRTSAVGTYTVTYTKDGAAGTRTAVLDLYQWANSPPAAPTGTSTYTWSTATFTTPSGAASWTTTPGTSTPGQTLYIARKVYTDTSTVATSIVDWGLAPLPTILTQGVAGVNGQRTGYLEVYKWSASQPVSNFPTGTSVYTWSNGTFTAPGTPNGWGVTALTSPTPGDTLWGISTIVTDTLTTTTSIATWNSTSPVAVGVSGINGTPGSTAVFAYRVLTGSTLPASPTIGINQTPTAGTATAGVGWYISPKLNLASNEWMFQVSGIKNPGTSTPQYIWETTTGYLSTFKVGELSALSVTTGSLLINNTLNISTSGVIKSTNSTGYGSTGIFLGWDTTGSSNYKFSVGTSPGSILSFDGSTLSIPAGSLQPGSTIPDSVFSPTGWLNSSISVNVNGVLEGIGTANVPVDTRRIILSETTGVISLLNGSTSSSSITTITNANRLKINNIATFIDPTAITGDYIAANTIVTKNLGVGDFTNQAKNWNFEEGDAGWTNDGGNWSITSIPAQAKSGSWVATRTNNVTPAVIRNTQKVPVNVGDVFYAEAFIKHVGASTGGSGTRVRIMAFNSLDGITEVSGQAAVGNFIPPTTTVYTKSTATITITSTTVACIQVEVEPSGMSTGTTYIDEVKLIRVSNSVLIADGAILADKIAVSAVTADKIIAGAITASKLVLTDQNNLYPDFDCEDSSFYTSSTGLTAASLLTATTSRPLGRRFISIPADSITHSVETDWFPVETSAQYLIAGSASTNNTNTDSGTASVSIQFSTMDSSGNPATTSTPILIGSRASNTSLALHIITVTTSSTECLARFISTKTNGTASGRFGAFTVRRRANSNLIVDGSVIADKIAANSISANKLVLADFSNLALNPDFSRGTTDGWAVGTAGSLTAVTAASTLPGGLLPSPTTMVGNVVINSAISSIDILSVPSAVSCSSGETYYFEAKVAGNSANLIYLQLYTRIYSAGVPSGTPVLLGPTVSSTTLNAGWTTISATYTIPSNDKWDRFIAGIRLNNPTSGSVYITGYRLRRMASSELIVDGAIIANKVAANAISANNIAANSISSSKLVVADFTNQAKNWDFEEGDIDWAKEGTWSITSIPAQAKSGSWVAARTGTAVAAAIRNGNTIRVNPGESFYAEAFIKHSAGATPVANSARIRIVVVNSSYAEVQRFDGSTVLATATTYTKSTAAGTVTSTSAHFLYVDIASDITSGTCYADEVKLIRSAGGNLIVDGAVTAKKITANGLTIKNDSGTILLFAGGDAVAPWVQSIDTAQSATGGYSLVDSADVTTNSTKLRTIAAGNGIEISTTSGMVTISSRNPAETVYLSADTSITSQSAWPTGNLFTRPAAFYLPLEASTYYKASGIMRIKRGSSTNGTWALSLETPTNTSVSFSASMQTAYDTTRTRNTFSPIGGGTAAFFDGVFHAYVTDAGTFSTGAWANCIWEAAIKTGTTAGNMNFSFGSTSGVTLTLGEGSFITVEKLSKATPASTSVSTASGTASIAESYTAVSDIIIDDIATASTLFIMKTNGTWQAVTYGATTATSTGTWLSSGDASNFDLIFEVTGTSGTASRSNEAGSYVQLSTDKSYNITVSSPYASSYSLLTRTSWSQIAVRVRNRVTGVVTTFQTVRLVGTARSQWIDPLL